MQTNKFWLGCLAVLNILALTAQDDCGCASSFKWLQKTFEENDAGFLNVVNRKGRSNYQQFTDSIAAKAEKIVRAENCKELMDEWLHYFRTGHIGAYLKVGSASANANKSEKDIKSLFASTPRIDLTEARLKEKLSRKKNINPIEGIWSYSNYRIGVIEDSKLQGIFRGFILNADGVYWQPGQIKVNFKSKDSRTFAAEYFLQDHTADSTTATLEDKKGLILNLERNKWVKEYPKIQSDKSEELWLRMLSTSTPFVSKLNTKTAYLRIPSFLAEQRQIIDSVLEKNRSVLLSAPNLIIDIRNGTGGSDGSFRGLIPFLYTNPIRVENIDLLATELNAQGYEKYARMVPSDTANFNRGNGIAKRMRQNIGKFIPLNNDVVSIWEEDSVMRFPQKVAIICNHNNGSADEQFLLLAKQSTKVKVFGEPTFGELDFSNVNVVFSLNNKFVLAYCMSRSNRVPNYCIDSVGIQPDYYIDKSIEPAEWINFVQNILEK